jgi:hypothetical protein
VVLQAEAHRPDVGGIAVGRAAAEEPDAEDLPGRLRTGGQGPRERDRNGPVQEGAPVHLSRRSSKGAV